MKQKQSLEVGDVYALQERETGKWFTFQIVQIGEQLGEEYAVFVDLDYWDEKIPEERDLKTISYLLLNHHNWNNEICHCWAPVKFFPSHAMLIGNMIVRPIEECRRFGNWPDGIQQKWQDKWEKLPKDQVLAFKDALGKFNEGETVIVAGKEMNKNLWGLFDDTLSAIKDFSELDKFPGLARISTSKDYPQLIPFLERRFLVHELVWDNCSRRKLDLSRTHLEELEISGIDVEDIYLPSSINKLTLKGKMSPNLRVHSPNEGYYMVLWVEMQDGFIPDIGLGRLTELHLNRIQDYSLCNISSQFPCLMKLWMTGKPGYIHDVAEIAKLPELETLTFWDLFGFSADDFPRPENLPQLRNLWLESVPAETGKKIKKLYKGKIQELQVLKLRSDEWLHENLNNPLRHWDGSEFVPKSKYKKSVALWKDTRRRILEEMSHSEIDFSAVKRIAIDYIEGFNKLDRRSSFIETEEREDIINAFEQILDEVGFQQGREELMLLMEEKRNW